MARRAFGCTISHGLPLQPGTVADPVNGASTVTDNAAVEAAVALLEADAATPTQAHVTALRGVWDTLAADIAGAPARGDVVISFDTATVATKNALRAALRALLTEIEGNGELS